MIHECLINIWKGPISLNSHKEWIHLLDHNDFLHPGEQKLLEIIINISLDYHKINSFTKYVLNQGLRNVEQSNKNVRNGLYITAFCNGVRKVLKDYRREIIKLENLFLHNPQVSLTLVLSSIEKYHHLFQTLLSMIQVIQEHNVHGCLLIGRLHKYGYCEINQITTVAELLIKTINQIFHRHLCNWIIYGELIDSFHEFFICDEKISDHNFLYHEQLSELSNKTTLQLNKANVRKPPHVRKFSINWHMVPAFVDKQTVENILFMGRIVWILRNDPKKYVKNNCQINFKKNLEDNEYYKTIKHLELHTFNKNEFQRIMTGCRSNLTKYMWLIMINEGRLIEHINLIRDYFAVGRGELFQQFIIVTEAYLDNPSSTSTIQNLNFIFHETARKIYGENERKYFNFELTMNSESMEKNPWTRLHLNFEIQWPLHIVFHPQVMMFYNKLFCFLLRLKKTQIDLHKLWLDQVSKKQQSDRRVWSLRQNLIFLINNLEYYFQVDVIETHFSLLHEAVHNANEFEDIIKVHHDFINNLLSKTFIATSDESYTHNQNQLYQIPAFQFEKSSKVYNIILKLLEFCDKFCSITYNWSAKLTEPQELELNEFQNRSQSIIESFLFILYRLHEKVKGQHLLQLLLQLDYNRYFSKIKPDLNLTVLV